MKKKIVIGISIVAVIVLIIVIIRRNKKNSELSNSSITSTNSTSPVNQNSSFPLKKGSQGESVKTLQKALNNVTPSIIIPLNIDGIFGTKTHSALQNYVGLSQITQSQFNKLVSIATVNRGFSGSKVLTTQEQTLIQNA